MSWTIWLRFLAPSSLGVGLLLVPVPYQGKVAIVLGHLVDAVQAALGEQLPFLVTWVIVVSALLALAFQGSQRLAKLVAGHRLEPILRPGWATTAVRVLGAAIALLVIARTGPDWLIGDATGGLILRELLPVVFVIFFVASLALPCLTDFGLMDLVGAVVSPIFRPLFALPGRSAVDAAASWFGAASVGVLITADQHQRAFYTDREAAVIATSFSVVSIAFAYVIIDFVALGDYFVGFYSTVVVCGLAAAVICPFLPPLRGKADRYVDGRRRAHPRRRPAATETSDSLSPLQAALRRAADGPGFREVLRRAAHTVIDIWLGLLPMVAVIGSLAIALAETTPLFRYLGAPFLPLLQLLGIPEAAAAAPAMVVGFADQFLPVVLGRSIDSELTRFVIACTSVNQLVYLSEVGVVILRSGLPLGLVDLALVFVVRTLLTLPIAAAAAHLLF